MNSNSNPRFYNNSDRLQHDNKDLRPVMNLTSLEPDEMRVIKECNSESFYHRSLPTGGAFGFAAYYLVNNGYLKANAKFGYWPKVLAASFFGFIVGKLSYRKQCEDKILLEIPNSSLAQLIRRRRGGRADGAYMNYYNDGFNRQIPPGPVQNTPYSNSETVSSDYDYNSFSNSDDFYRPDFDDKKIPEENLFVPESRAATYDELRKQNRDEYYGQFQKRSGQSYTSPLEPQVQQPKVTQSPPSNPEDPGYKFF